MKDVTSILDYTLVSTEKMTITVYKLLMAILVIFITMVLLWGLRRVFKRTILKKQSISQKAT